MQTANLQQLRDDAAGVIAATQAADVLVVEDGKVLAVVSRPPATVDFEEYWSEREQSLQHVVADSAWDSAIAVSQDRESS